MKYAMVMLTSLAMVAAPALQGQPSTDRLRDVSQRLHFEIAAGAELFDLGSSIGVDRGGGSSATAGRAAVHWPQGRYVAIGLEAWLVQRRVDGTDWSPNNVPLRASGTEHLWAAGPLVEFGISLKPRLRLSTEAGVAMAFAKGVNHESQQGAFVMLGANLTYGRLVIGQHFLGLQGAQAAVPEHREYYPLTVGIIF